MRGASGHKLRIVGPLLVVGVAGCGSGGSGSGTGASTPAAKRPGCSQFCQQAGPSGGPNFEGCTPQGCQACPSAGCLDVLSSTARVVNGTVDVRLRCRVSIACDGALLLLQQGREIGPNGER